MLRCRAHLEGYRERTRGVCSAVARVYREGYRERTRRGGMLARGLPHEGYREKAAVYAFPSRALASGKNPLSAPSGVLSPRKKDVDCDTVPS